MSVQKGICSVAVMQFVQTLQDPISATVMMVMKQVIVDVKVCYI